MAPKTRGGSPVGTSKALRQTAHNLANHLLALQLRIQEVLMNPACMATPAAPIIKTMERLAVDATGCLRLIQGALNDGARPLPRAPEKKRRRHLGSRA